MSTSASESLNVITDFQQIAEAWVASKEGKYALESVRTTEFVLQSIAQGEPISVEAFADFSGLTLKEAKVQYRQMRMSGADFDEAGRLIGNALTMRPTRNMLMMDGRTLYAWCALDTLFLPGLVGKTATVQSVSPISGETIQLTVSPEGIQSFDPPDLVLSVVVPGVSRACELGRPGGAQGEVCRAMHFFANRQEAEEYLGAGTDVAILTVEQAAELAQLAWVRPYRSVVESADKLAAER
ncbi:MAG: organomercurial lyase [Anaerolineales bacterium]